MSRWLWPKPKSFHIKELHYKYIKSGDLQYLYRHDGVSSPLYAIVPFLFLSCSQQKSQVAAVFCKVYPPHGCFGVIQLVPSLSQGHYSSTLSLSMSILALFDVICHWKTCWKQQVFSIVT